MQSYERLSVSDRLLLWLSEQPDRATATNAEIAEAINASVRSISLALERLEADGAIRRDFSAPDRHRGRNGRRIVIEAALERN